MSTPTITHFGTSRTREAPPLGRVFTYKTLPMKGIDYHPNHIRRLVHAGKFPKPVHLGARKPVWLESELDAWIAERTAERKIA
jgi:hypothetical protein